VHYTGLGPYETLQFGKIRKNVKREKFEDGCLLGKSAMLSGRSLPTFQRSLLPSSSGRFREKLLEIVSNLKRWNFLPRTSGYGGGRLKSCVPFVMTDERYKLFYALVKP
jgi:hypothetical protein